MSKSLHIIILAAGAGTRMGSRLPKVLHRVADRPMILHVLATATQLEPEAVHVVYNPGAPELKEACEGFAVQWAPQAQQLGTGHALQQAMPHVPDAADVLVLYGDTPLVRAQDLEPLLDAPRTAIRVLSMSLPEPAGYGRIVRDAEGRLSAIIEERDASATEKAICEVNSGIIMAPASALQRCLQALDNDNDQREYYLTDIIAIARAKGIATEAVRAPDGADLAGANDRAQLAGLERRFQAREAARLMSGGAQLADPARVDVRGDIHTGEDVFIDVNVVLQGVCDLGDGVSLGPGCVLKDCRLAAGTRVHAYSVLEGVQTLGACDIGPFARLRPGTTLASGSKVGNFVEVKNTSLGKHSKASHLTYLGDSRIGDRVNIGAGTITCNYDGVNKHRTVIGDDVFIGSDTQLIAPVSIGDGADIAAGTTVTRDAPAGKLTISRTQQVTVEGWKRPQKK